MKQIILGIVFFMIAFEEDWTNNWGNFEEKTYFFSWGLLNIGYMF